MDLTIKPYASYIIWFTPRTGSTLLCKALEDTGVAGKPGEYLNDPQEKSLAEFYQVQDMSALQRVLWRKGMSDNGVFGIKYSLYQSHHSRLASELNNLTNQPSIEPWDWKVLAPIFPNCKHIFLSRRNKVRLAVSWWRAIQDHQWHRKTNDEKNTSPEFYADKYNYDALLHLFKESSMREAAIEHFFATNGIRPLTIIYEDFIRNYEGTLRNVLNYLEIPNAEVKFKAPFFQKTADEHSDIWVERLRKDMQDGWNNVAW